MMGLFILVATFPRAFRPGLTHSAPPGLEPGRRDQARRPTSIGGIDAGDSGHNYETCVAPPGLYLTAIIFPGLPPWANSFRPSGAGAWAPRSGSSAYKHRWNRCR